MVVASQLPDSDHVKDSRDGERSEHNEPDDGYWESSGHLSADQASAEPTSAKVMFLKIATDQINPDTHTPKRRRGQNTTTDPHK